jgi:imidazolonepropionase-like amidohydrolase
MFITIAGDRIVDVLPAARAQVPAGAAVVDLSRFTVLPGLIGCHVHLSSRTDRPDRFAEIWEFKDTPFDAAFAAVLNARRHWSRVSRRSGNRARSLSWESI